MTRRGQLRLYYHGAIFILAAMAIGGPGLWIALNYGLEDDFRQLTRQSHSILISAGIWLIASGAAVPLLDLTDRAVSWLVGLLVFSGYSFLASIGVLALVLILSPGSGQSQWQKLMHAHYHLGYVYLAILVASGLASLLGGLAIIRGARKALRQSILNAVH